MSSILQRNEGLIITLFRRLKTIAADKGRLDQESIAVHRSLVENIICSVPQQFRAAYLFSLNVHPDGRLSKILYRQKEDNSLYFIEFSASQNNLVCSHNGIKPSLYQAPQPICVKKEEIEPFEHLLPLFRNC